ncbi:hypothetical protein H072_6197 [Dactylellina haptotyla CBS 200.50]|uniref:Peptidase M6-like domain-containing protein n=1 Tax=Dactylellina haptotyla (strain CBS 200.50) TaxID=1284197 RepID=S8BXE9_DACHA|nr:hypothetical protein H072_6197 [Dactylellina haptotyla CBS 200.50]
MWPAIVVGGLLCVAHAAPAGHALPSDPFAVIDPQSWTNPDNMTWADYRVVPGTNWADPTRKGSKRNFNIALVTVDYPDLDFIISQPAHSTIFDNPQPITAAKPARNGIPAFYRDLLNKPSDLNRGHTLHEYWMEDSGGSYGVDLTAFGPYRLPGRSYQYGITNDMNPGECPKGERCNINIRTDALGAWRSDVGNQTASGFELVFILSAGQDESSTWQEFGEMRFQTPQDVPDAFGPPVNSSNHANYARTRYVDWTSWASAAAIWPNAGSGSSTQAESSGMGTYAHELSHLLSIGDNYNNPYGIPLRRAYTGPWSMMSRGSFNGPGGPHSRWQVPALQGGSMGSLHTMRDKSQLGLVSDSAIIRLDRNELAKSGLVVARATARCVNPPGKNARMGLHINMDKDRSPTCDDNTQPLCDGGGYDGYEVEVVDRMGSDSFTPDSGVLISKVKKPGAYQPFQWVIDANPQDIGLVDFFRPNGSIAMITLGDYRQLADALFHAGTRSGSQYEYLDSANRLHFYILERNRDTAGVLSYSVAVRSLDGSGPSKRGVTIGAGKVVKDRKSKATGKGVTCVFKLGNTGSYAAGGNHPGNVTEYLKSDVYRLSAQVAGKGWRVELPNALATAQFGASITVSVAVGATVDADSKAAVKLTAVSESDGAVKASAECQVCKS